MEHPIIAGMTGFGRTLLTYRIDYLLDEIIKVFPYLELLPTERAISLQTIISLDNRKWCSTFPAVTFLQHCAQHIYF